MFGATSSVPNRGARHRPGLGAVASSQSAPQSGLILVRLDESADMRHRVAPKSPSLRLAHGFDPAEFSDDQLWFDSAHPARLAERGNICRIGHGLNCSSGYHDSQAKTVPGRQLGARSRRG